MDAQPLSHPPQLRVLTDAESTLIALVKQGQQSAFKQLYQLHVRRIYTLCLRLTGQPSLAEDVTQEVFIQLWRKIDTFRGDSSFVTWLHSLATNTALSYLRKQKSWWQRLQATDDYEQLSSQMEANMPPNLDDLQTALSCLPERARIIFVLHAIEGYRQESIAQVLGITTGTVKAQFHRAKQLLENRLDNNAGVAS